MTNGEMIQKVFKGCEVCEPISEEDIIHVIFPDKNDSAIGFDWSWWNMEHKEPTTKNDLGVEDCVSRAEVLKLMKDNWHTHNGDWAMQESMDDIRALPSVTPQEPILDKIFSVVHSLSIMSTPELEHKAIMQIAEILEPLCLPESEDV